MYQIGQLVNWRETYNDITITKDHGIGVVTDIQTVDSFSKLIYIYKIYRVKKRDFVLYEDFNLELTKEIEK